MPSLWERLRIRRAREAALEGGAQPPAQFALEQSIPYYRQPRWWLKAGGITLLVLCGAGVAVGFFATIGWPALVTAVGVAASYVIVAAIGAVGAALFYAASSWLGKKVGQYYAKRASNTNNPIVTPTLKASADSPAIAQDVIAATPVVDEKAVAIVIKPTVAEPSKSGSRKTAGKKKASTDKKGKKQPEEIQREEQEQKELENLEQEIALYWDSYLAVFGLKPDATPEQIKGQYRKLALQYHPDKNGSPEAQKIIRKINTIYDVLEQCQFVLPTRLKPLYNSLAGERELLERQNEYFKEVDEYFKEVDAYSKHVDAYLKRVDEYFKRVADHLKHLEEHKEKIDFLVGEVNLFLEKKQRTKQREENYIRLGEEYIKSSKQLHEQAAVAIPEIGAIAKHVEASTARTQQHAESAERSLEQIQGRAADLMERLSQAEAKLDRLDKHADKAGSSSAPAPTGTKLSWTLKKSGNGKDAAVADPNEKPQADAEKESDEKRVPPPPKK